VALWYLGNNARRVLRRDALGTLLAGRSSAEAQRVRRVVRLERLRLACLGVMVASLAAFVMVAGAGNPLWIAELLVGFAVLAVGLGAVASLMIGFLGGLPPEAGDAS
ncbi:MAG: hypothetical protein V2A73_05450, partial [Pseudomonadota bacterium]